MNWLIKIERAVSATFLAFMTLFVFIDVVGREFMGASIPWAQKSAVYLMIWAAFIGASLSSSSGVHLRPEIADKMWAKHPMLFIRIQQSILTVFCAAAAYFCTMYVAESREFGDTNVMTGMPMWILQAVMPLVFALMTLKHLAFAIYPERHPKKEIAP